MRVPVSDLQHRLDLGGDVGLLVQLDALFVGAARTLHGDALQVGQHHAVGLRHRLELVKQQLQQLQQQAAEGAREKGREKKKDWMSGGRRERRCSFFLLEDLTKEITRLLYRHFPAVFYNTGDKKSPVGTIFGQLFVRKTHTANHLALDFYVDNNSQPPRESASVLILKRRKFGLTASLPP